MIEIDSWTILTLCVVTYATTLVSLYTAYKSYTRSMEAEKTVEALKQVLRYRGLM